LKGRVGPWDSVSLKQSSGLELDWAETFRNTCEGNLGVGVREIAVEAFSLEPERF